MALPQAETCNDPEMEGFMDCSAVEILDACPLIPPVRRKTPLWKRHFDTRNDLFTKTGSGQT